MSDLKINIKDKDMDHLWNNCSLTHIYEASVFLKTTLNDVRYQWALQFVADIESEPPSPLSAYICVHIIVGQLEFHRNYLSAVHIVFMYYWDVVRKDNIINKVLLDLSNSFQIENTFIRETIIRAEMCLKRIEKEMTTIATTINTANVISNTIGDKSSQVVAVEDNHPLISIPMKSSKMHHLN
ncbi:unnamed protein product [Oppiella nova]|uniref:Uncharacterized protein n=1 Tax=Oppiella nova TaxID=334625 RepID=A0A7R9M4G4_9ACAR|nr:unnamed protein product [Oppiella nova]CAG2170487.1 unnamed protein product [Oppiella nova]